MNKKISAFQLPFFGKIYHIGNPNCTDNSSYNFRDRKVLCFRSTVHTCISEICIFVGCWALIIGKKTLLLNIIISSQNIAYRILNFPGCCRSCLSIHGWYAFYIQLTWKKTQYSVSLIFFYFKCSFEHSKNCLLKKKTSENLQIPSH